MAARILMPWRKMWDFLSACSVHGDLQSMLRQAILDLPALIPCEQAVAPVAEMLSTRGDIRVTLLTNTFPPEAVRPYCDYYFYKDEARLGMSPQAQTFQVDWRQRGFGKSEFVHDFIRGLMRIDMSAGLPIFDHDGAGGTCLIIARTGTGSLSRREESILLALRPHLVNLYALHKRLQALSPDDYFAAERAGTCELLSRREAEIAALLCKRVRAGEIATLLLISRRTVETHIEHIYTKLNVHTRRELVGRIMGSPGDGQSFSAQAGGRSYDRLL